MDYVGCGIVNSIIIVGPVQERNSDIFTCLIVQHLSKIVMVD